MNNTNKIILFAFCVLLASCNVKKDNGTHLVGPGITIEIEPFPMGEIWIENPGGLA